MSFKLLNMKNLLVLAFVAALAVSCSKKESNYVEDSNTMLQEPEVQTVDSAMAKPADQTSVAQPDSAAVVVDSAVVN